jgi:hypothetical protein
MGGDKQQRDESGRRDDLTDTDHRVGEDQADENSENELPG